MKMTFSLPHYSKINRTKHLTYTRTDYLRLDMNEKPYPLPKEIIDTILKDINPEKISTYPEIYSLFDKVSKKFNIPKENLLFTDGSESAIRYVFQTYMDKGDNVLSVSPTFAMVPIYAKMFKANYTEVKYNVNLNLDIDKLIEIIEEQDIKMFYLPNPNSPTGTVLSDAEMHKLLKATNENNVVFLLDEAYVPFYETSYMMEFNKYENLVIVRSFSKYFGLPSIRLGFIVSREINIDDIFKVVPTYEVNAFAILFGEKIFDFENLLHIYLLEIEKGKQKIVDFCKDNNLDYIKTKTNFMFIKVGKEVAMHLGNWLKKEKKILVKYGFDHPALESCIRFSLGNEQQMDYLLSSIKYFLDIRISE